MLVRPEGAVTNETFEYQDYGNVMYPEPSEPGRARTALDPWQRQFVLPCFNPPSHHPDHFFSLIVPILAIFDNIDSRHSIPDSSLAIDYMYILYSAFYLSSPLFSLQSLLKCRISASNVLSSPSFLILFLVALCFVFSSNLSCLPSVLLGCTFTIIFCFSLGYLLLHRFRLLLCPSVCNRFVIKLSSLTDAFEIKGIDC